MKAPWLVLVAPSDAADFASRRCNTSIYALKPGVTQADIGDHLDDRLAQLQGLLAMTYGDQGKAFRNLNDELQDCFMWACYDLAEECRALAGLTYEVPDTATPSINITGATQ